MNAARINYFRDKLLSEKNRVTKIMTDMKRNDITDLNEEMENELSLWDNYPADIGTIREDMETTSAFKGNEVSILKKIDDALRMLDEGDYGICKRCGKPILQERLEVLPYAVFCTPCEKQIH